MDPRDRELYIERITEQIREYEGALVQANDDVEIARMRMAAAMERRDQAIEGLDRAERLRAQVEAEEETS